MSHSPPHRRRDSVFRYPTSVEIVAQALRRTTSSDMLPLNSSPDGTSDGGYSDTLSPSTRPPPKAVSESGAFLFGSFEHDDVFEASSPPGGASLSGVEEGSSKTPDSTSRELISTSPADAQSKYPTKFALFIANLAIHCDDESLLQELDRIFSQFGECYVKLKRDKSNLPYAFAQYTTEEDAARAFNLARGAIVFNRPLRTEMCNGSVHFIVFKTSGERITTQEAERLLEPYGHIASVKDVNLDIQQRLAIPQSKLVSYEKYDSKRDVIKATGSQSLFTVKKFDPKTTSDGTVVLHPNRAFVGQPDHDLNTIFVGNLPPWIDEPKVRHLTSQCGTVRNVQVRDSKNPHRGNYFSKFAFVVYDRPEAVGAALTRLDGEIVGTPDEGQYKIRVERKKARVPQTPQRALVASSHPSSYGSHSVPYPLSTTSHASSVGRTSLASSSSVATSNALVRATPHRGHHASYGPSNFGVYHRASNERFHTHPRNTAAPIHAAPHTGQLVPLGVAAEATCHYTLPSVPQPTGPQRATIAESPAAHIRVARAPSAAGPYNMSVPGQEAAAHKPFQETPPATAQNIVPPTSESTFGRVEEPSSNPDTPGAPSSASNSDTSSSSPGHLAYKGNMSRPHRRAGRYATAPVSSNLVAQRAADRAAARLGMAKAEEAGVEKGTTAKALVTNDTVTKSDEKPAVPPTTGTSRSAPDSADVQGVEKAGVQAVQPAQSSHTMQIAQAPVFVPAGLSLPVPMNMAYGNNMNYMGFPTPHPLAQHVQMDPNHLVHNHHGMPHQLLSPGFAYFQGRFGKWVCDMMGTPMFLPVEHLPLEQRPLLPMPVPPQMTMPTQPVVNPLPQASSASPSREADDGNDKN